MPFDQLLDEFEMCSPGIICVECLAETGVYEITWKNDVDYLCEECLKKFVANEFKASGSTGDLRKRFLVFSRDNFKCVYCGRNPREHDTTLEIEHVHPKSKGGSDSIDNLVTACRECNAGKGDYILNKRNLDMIKQHRR
ncbi:HNH endonuclease [Candidatus Saccharibacteria bacterium]|nr:HNH endonuclease [Candidatus Saccharibacteria bacterium]